MEGRKLANSLGTTNLNCEHSCQPAKTQNKQIHSKSKSNKPVELLLNCQDPHMHSGHAQSRDPICANLLPLKPLKNPNILLHGSSFSVEGIIRERLISALQCPLFFAVNFLFESFYPSLFLPHNSVLDPFWLTPHNTTRRSSSSPRLAETAIAGQE